MENMLPKFELVPIMMYFMMLPKVRGLRARRARRTAEIVVEQDDVRRVLGDVDGAVHRDADIGRVQRRRVVDAVAEIADDVAATLQRQNDAVLLRRA